MSARMGESEVMEVKLDGDEKSKCERLGEENGEGHWEISDCWSRRAADHD